MTLRALKKKYPIGTKASTTSVSTGFTYDYLEPIEVIVAAHSSRGAMLILETPWGQRIYCSRPDLCLKIISKPEESK